MTKEINLGNLVIPIIKPLKGVDYYTETEKNDMISTVTSNVNSVVMPQEQVRQSAETARQSAETIRQSNETTRQTNETNRQNAETTRAENEITRQNNETARVSAEEERVQTFNNQMQSVDTALSGIHTSQAAYDENAEAKLEAYNTNASSKTTAYNENATSKTSDFNTNASNKTTAFNDNATAKTSAFDEHTAEIQAKLATIEEGAEVNVIETVKVNGTALTPTDKAVDVEVPTKTSDLTNDSGFGTYSKPSGGIPKTDLATDVQTSLNKADTAIQSHQDITGKEDKSNKVTELSAESTDTQYPSAKAVYDIKAEQDAEIERLQTQVSDLKKNSLTYTPTPATSHDLSDSADMEVESFGVSGNSVQDGTPTPSNPISIKSCGDNGSITEKIVNKNLYNATTAIRAYIDGSYNIVTNSNNVLSDFIKIVKDKPYSASLVKSAQTGGYVIYDNEKNPITRNTSMPIFNGTTFNSDGYIRVWYNAKGSAITIDEFNEEYKPQFEQSSTATDYVEHQEQTYTIPVQSPFRSIGDTRDNFVKQNGVWYERHNFRSLNLAIANMNNSESYPGWKNVTQIKSDYPDKSDALQMFTRYMSNISTSNYGVGINTTGNNSIIHIKGISNLTQSEWKTNYPDLVFNLVYKLQNPELTQCTSEQTAILESLPRTYKNVTHIYSEDEVEAYVDVTYYKDLETVIDNLSSAITVLGGE